MNLHGWRQLIEWSIQHSCMTAVERASAEAVFRNEWAKFVDRTLETYEGYALNLPELS